MFFIGADIRNRMELLNLSVTDVADSAFLEEEEILSVINNEIPYEEIDEFVLSMLCSVLHCEPKFFTDGNIRKNDLLLSSMNRGNDNEKSVQVKAKIQSFLNDYAFIKEVLSETD